MSLAVSLPDFGKKDPVNFVGLTIKIISLLIPGAIMGHYLDQYINKLKNQYSNLHTSYFILLQTLSMIFIFYLLINYLKPYTLEFQSTYAGLFFVAFFFGIQSNYISNIQEVLGKT